MFKQCTKCGKQFRTKEEFILLTEFVCTYQIGGLALRNCSCQTTLAAYVEQLYPDWGFEKRVAQDKIAVALRAKHPKQAA